MADHRRILFVQHAANLTGSTFSGAQICRAMCALGWHVDVVFGYEGAAQDLYRAIGCDVHVLPHKNWLAAQSPRGQTRRWISEGRAMLGFSSFIARQEPELVYVNSLVSASAILAAKARRLPRIWHLRELFDDVGGEMAIPPLGGRALARHLIRGLADRVIAPSRAIVENVFGTAAVDVSVDVVPNAANASFFEALPARGSCRSEWNLPADAVVVGVPGTLRPIKGHLFFLDAFAAIASRRPELHALISGELCDADYGRALHAAIAKYDLQSRLHLTGPVADMRRFYAACDVVCVPSRAESFGRTVVESFATGVPLVASNVGGIAEIVTPEKTGLLIEFGDVVALSSSLSRLLDDAELRNRFARAARADSEQRFHESAYARRILSIVQQLLTAHSAQPIVSANENRALVS